MKQFPQPGEDPIIMEHMKVQAELKMKYQAPEKNDPEKEERQRKRFQKEHPELYDEDTGAVGEAISVNGELIDTKTPRRKKRIARWYRFLHWLKS